MLGEVEGEKDGEIEGLLSGLELIEGLALILGLMLALGLEVAVMVFNRLKISFKRLWAALRSSLALRNAALPSSRADLAASVLAGVMDLNLASAMAN